MLIHTTLRDILYHMFKLYYYLKPRAVEQFVEFRNICNVHTWFQQQKFTNHQIHVIFCNVSISSAVSFLSNWPPFLQ